ncbi:hypothetical protein B296_00006118 [Ensete ventricosum]|uniref:Uncharacterized protein n=1 Tax=Ensete ventricosum TaxID=4639 RepID=A0A426ZQY6_ENSVE|nr:hypothetical protein B296_00006118 [Ensete ventricosum]
MLSDKLKRDKIRSIVNFIIFEPPVTVGEVTGNPPTHSRLSLAHPLGFGSIELRPDDYLEPGSLYFLLPDAVIHSESSPVGDDALMTQFTAFTTRGGAHGVAGSEVALGARPN